MIYIRKGHEPPCLLQYRKNTPGASYDTLPTTIKDTIKIQLLQEQGHLCAYCMRSLKTLADVQIEHYFPQKPQDSVGNNGLDYHIMLAVCPGNKGNPPKQTTCDTHRRNTPLTVNPLRPHGTANIQYRSDGTIYSVDAAVQKDLDETLNLNCSAVSLPQCRKGALDRLKKELYATSVNKTLSARKLNAYLRHYENPQHYVPYVGILRAYLQKKLNQVNK